MIFQTFPHVSSITPIGIFSYSSKDLSSNSFIFICFSGFKPKILQRYFQKFLSVLKAVLDFSNHSSSNLVKKAINYFSLISPKHFSFSSSRKTPSYSYWDFFRSFFFQILVNNYFRNSSGNGELCIVSSKYYFGNVSIVMF